jgi:long-subunit fatty acid transport protein
LFVNQPYGADAKYTAGFYTGLEAHWSSDQIAALVKYDVSAGFSVYGGAKYVTSKAEIAIPDQMIRASIGQAAQDLAAQAALASGPLATQLATQANTLGALAQNQQVNLAYNATTETDSQTALIVGAAYERPEIALRVGLTYEQGFTHSFASSETLPVQLGGSMNGKTEIEMPRSITLDFQSGVAKDTLVFGMIRYSNWSVWEVRPPLYNAAFKDDVTSIDNDVTTYQLGVGRRLNDNLSVFGRVTYEEAKGGVASRLAPTDGSTSIGIGATYRQDKLKITGGIEYASLGSATDASGTSFTGSNALGLGVQIGYSF